METGVTVGSGCFRGSYLVYLYLVYFRFSVTLGVMSLKLQDQNNGDQSIEIKTKAFLGLNLTKMGLEQVRTRASTHQ